MRDVGGKIFVNHHIEGLGRLVFQDGIDGRSGGMCGEVVAVQRLESLGHGIRVRDGFQGLQSVQVVDQDRYGLGTVHAQEGGEAEQERGIREDRLQMIAGEQLLGAGLEREGWSAVTGRRHQVIRLRVVLLQRLQLPDLLRRTFGLERGQHRRGGAGLMRLPRRGPRHGGGALRAIEVLLRRSDATPVPTAVVAVSRRFGGSKHSARWMAYLARVEKCDVRS